MKFFAKLLVLGLAADVTLASSWFSKAGMYILSILPLCLQIREMSQDRMQASGA
jgi:hypothetical protein